LKAQGYSDAKIKAYLNPDTEAPKNTHARNPSINFLLDKNGEELRLSNVAQTPLELDEA